jgi:hypothetical protein
MIARVDLVSETAEPFLDEGIAVAIARIGEEQ